MDDTGFEQLAFHCILVLIGSFTQTPNQQHEFIIFNHDQHTSELACGSFWKLSCGKITSQFTLVVIFGTSENNV